MPHSVGLLKPLIYSTLYGKDKILYRCQVYREVCEYLSSLGISTKVYTFSDSLPITIEDPSIDEIENRVSPGRAIDGLLGYASQLASADGHDILILPYMLDPRWESEDIERFFANDDVPKIIARYDVLSLPYIVESLMDNDVITLLNVGDGYDEEMIENVETTESDDDDLITLYKEMRRVAKDEDPVTSFGSEFKKYFRHPGGRCASYIREMMKGGDLEAVKFVLKNAEDNEMLDLYKEFPKVVSDVIKANIGELSLTPGYSECIHRVCMDYGDERLIQIYSIVNNINVPICEGEASLGELIRQNPWINEHLPVKYDPSRDVFMDEKGWQGSMISADLPLSRDVYYMGHKVSLEALNAKLDKIIFSSEEDCGICYNSFIPGKLCHTCLNAICGKCRSEVDRCPFCREV